ncbi:MAG: cupin domain-containing protein [Candidatus Zixiibacteriota bacterium]
MTDEKKKSVLDHSKAFNLEQLVDYSEGAVVSRTLSKSEAGTVTLFSFDTGQALSEHSAPFDAIVQILDGDAELIIGGEKIVAKTGQIVIMPRDIPHAVSAVNRFKMLLIMIRGK